MLPPLLKNYPPNSNLFRWLHELVNMWDGEDNHYTYKFASSGNIMPRREYQVRVSQSGQKQVEEMVRSAIQSYKKGQLVDLGKKEEELQNAFDLIRSQSHYTRLRIREAFPFIVFFLDLLQTVEMYGLELTRSGKQALARLRRAREENRYTAGNLCEVEELLEELDQLVDGMLLGDADAAKDIQASSTSSEWWEFFPPVMPLSVTLHLDVYVQSAHSKEEWANNKHLFSDQGLGRQQVDPSNDTAVEAEEGQCPSPSGVDTTTQPAPMADQFDKWSTSANCNEA